MGNSPSARRRTHSSASASYHRTPAPAKIEKARPPSAPLTAIDVSKFAPKHTIESNFSDNSECPICFLNYEALNESTCCKQLICTECYLLMKFSATPTIIKCPCPFCSNETLNIVYHPSPKAICLPEKASQAVQDSVKTAETGSFVQSLPSPDGSKATDDEAKHRRVEDSPSAFRRKVLHDVNIPICSINDRNDIENEIQKQRMKYIEDQPTPRPPSARTRAGDAYMESLTQSFARRNYNSNNIINYSQNNNNLTSEFNATRGTMSDFEHAALRLRFAVAIGERNSERLSQRLMMPNANDNPGAIPTAGRSLSPSIMRAREQNVMNDYLENRTVERISADYDLERIEEMMMMEAMKQSMESTPMTSFPLTSASEDFSNLRDSNYSTTSTCIDVPSRKNNYSEKSGKYNYDGLNNTELNSKVSSSSGSTVASTSTSTSTLSVSTPLQNGYGKKVKEDTTTLNTTKYNDKNETAAFSEAKSVINISVRNINNNIHDLQHNNLSDCESDAGVSVIAWDEMIRHDEKGGCKIENDDTDDVVTINFVSNDENIDNTKKVEKVKTMSTTTEHFAMKNLGQKSETNIRNCVTKKNDREIVDVKNDNHNKNNIDNNALISAKTSIYSKPSLSIPSSMVPSSSSFTASSMKSSTLDSTYYHHNHLISPVDSKHSSFQFNSDFISKVIYTGDNNDYNNRIDNDNIDFGNHEAHNINFTKSNHRTESESGLSNYENNYNEKNVDSYQLNTIKKDNADITLFQTLPHKRSSPNKLPRPHNMKFGEMSSFNYSTSSLASDGHEDTIGTGIEKELMLECDTKDFLCRNEIDQDLSKVKEMVEKEEEKEDMKILFEKVNHADIYKSENLGSKNQIATFHDDIESEELLQEINLSLNKEVKSQSKPISKSRSEIWMFSEPGDLNGSEYGISLGTAQRPKTATLTQSDVMSEHKSDEEFIVVNNMVEKEVIYGEEAIDANVNTLLVLGNTQINLPEVPLNCASYESTIYSEEYGSYEIEDDDDDDEDEEEYAYSEEEEEEEEEEDDEEVGLVLNVGSNIRADHDYELELNESAEEFINEKIISKITAETMDSSNNNDNDNNNDDNDENINNLLIVKYNNGERIVDEVTGQQDDVVDERNTEIRDDEQRYRGLEIAYAATERDNIDDDENDDDKTRKFLDEETKEGEEDMEVIMVIDVKECSESEEEASSCLSDNTSVISTF